jgi:hypothetical protein
MASTDLVPLLEWSQPSQMGKKKGVPKGKLKCCQYRKGAEMLGDVRQAETRGDWAPKCVSPFCSPVGTEQSQHRPCPVPVTWHREASSPPSAVAGTLRQPRGEEHAQ